MNEELIDILFSVTGLPKSAMVGHALLVEDLGVDEQIMPTLFSKIRTIMKVSIPEYEWPAFERVRDIDDYISNSVKAEKKATIEASPVMERVDMFQ